MRERGPGAAGRDRVAVIDGGAVAFLVVAASFAVVNGFNDGGTIVATSLHAPGLRPIWALVALGLALGVAPLLGTSAVAETLTTGFVAAPAGRRSGLLALGVVAASVVVLGLGRRGLPTSLTLATVGGIVGAGLGGGLPVSWGTVGRVLAVGALAPVVGAALAFVLARLPLLLAATRRGSWGLPATHVAAFGLQASAYAANDGQKVLAVLAVAAATAGVPAGWVPPAASLLFVAGALVGLRRIARLLGGGLVPARPSDQIAAEFASAGAVLGSAAVAAPVSMTQAVAGGLIGAGIVRGSHRIRWRAAGRLGMAWALTVPTAIAAGAVLALLEGVVT